jgi:hypothetical protein
MKVLSEDAVKVRLFGRGTFGIRFHNLTCMPSCLVIGEYSLRGFTLYFTVKLSLLQKLFHFLCFYTSNLSFLLLHKCIYCV